MPRGARARAQALRLPHKDRKTEDPASPSRVAALQEREVLWRTAHASGRWQGQKGRTRDVVRCDLTIPIGYASLLESRFTRRMRRMISRIKLCVVAAVLILCVSCASVQLVTRSAEAA